MQAGGAGSDAWLAAAQDGISADVEAVIGEIEREERAAQQKQRQRLQAQRSMASLTAGSGADPRPHSVCCAIAR